MGQWGRPRSGKDYVIYIMCRKEVFWIWKELENELIKKKRGRITYEDILLELLRFHPKGQELMKKYNLYVDKEYLW